MSRNVTIGHDKGPTFLIMAFFFAVVVVIQGCTPGPEKASSFKTLFDHYRERENVLAISFPPGLVGLFLGGEGPDQKELKELFSELSTFRMLSVTEEAHDSALAGELRHAVADFTIRNKFEDLIRVQGEAQDVFIRILEKEGTIKEAVIMVWEKDGFFVIDLRGNIDPNLFTRLADDGQLRSLIDLAGTDS